MKKKAQIWGLDLMIATIIFLIGIIAFYIYSINYPSEAEEKLNSLNYDGNLIIDSILSEGYPESRDSGNVLRIGILNDNQVNQSKLEQFYFLALNNYPKTKSLFNTKYDYYFFFSEPLLINGQQIQGIGKPVADIDNIPSSSLIKITRFTAYNKKPIPAYLYIWE